MEKIGKMFIENSRYKIQTPNGFKSFKGIRTKKDKTIKFVLSDNSYIQVTKNHIFDKDKIAKKLKIGDELPCIDGNKKIDDIIYFDYREDVFDPVGVDGYLYIGNGVINHNCEFLGSANTVVDAETLKILINQSIEPSFIDMNGKFLIYKKPEVGCQYIIGCLPEGEEVLTDEGYKKVENVNPYNKLISNEGFYTDIKNIQVYKNYEGNLHDIYLYGSYRKCSFTDEHPIYASKQPLMKRRKNHSIYGNKRYREFDFNFTKAIDIEKNDWVCFPNIYKNKKSIDLNVIWDNYEKCTRKDFEIKNPLYDKDFWWFVGIWLGDGWIQNRKNSYTVFTCHNSKTESLNTEKIKKIFLKYNRKCLVYEKGNNTLYCQFNSKQIHNFLKNNFGKYAKYKKIPEWTKFLPDKYKINILKGYLDSDGCFIKNNNRIHTGFVSISLSLLEGIQDIFYSMGILPSLSRLRKECKRKIMGKTCNIQETYQLRLDNFDTIKFRKLIGIENDMYLSKRNRNKRYSYFSEDEKYIYFRVKKVEKKYYCGNVYNFQTNSGTFICRNIPTHNCDTAKGTGEHYSVCQVLKIINMNPIELEQVAVYINNEIDVYKFSDLINRMSYYYNNAYIIVENNAEGAAVVNRLWWDLENENLVNTGSKATNLGIRATRNTKPRAVLLMKKLIEDGSLKLIDVETIEELTTFVDENGKFFGKEKDDDAVSALYWACFIFEMSILDDSMEFKKEEKEEEDGWGILSDINTNDEYDWSWLTE